MIFPRNLFTWKRLLLLYGSMFVLSICFFGLLATVSYIRESRERQESHKRIDAVANALHSADAHWASGDQASAVASYVRLLGQSYLIREAGGDMGQIYTRIIDFQTAQAGPEAARDYVRQAIRFKVPLLLSNKEAGALLAEERATHDADEKQYQQAHGQNATADVRTAGRAGSTVPLRAVGDTWHDGNTTITRVENGQACTPTQYSQLVAVTGLRMRKGMSREEVQGLLQIAPTNKEHMVFDAGVPGLNPNVVMESWKWESSDGKELFVCFSDGAVTMVQVERDVILH